MMIRSSFLYLFILMFILVGCSHQESQQRSPLALNTVHQTDQWSDYWYAGEAEISIYHGKQARYSDQHPAQAVLIFVTEDFLTDKQVKDESGTSNSSVSVLKTNWIKRFTTGIYDYSQMTSVFTPVNANQHPGTLKITTSSQDWCGQSFVQLNLRNKQYHVQLFSYFEAENDQDFKVREHLTEDELFNRIRLGPDALPSGEIELIPGTTYARLKHQSLEPTTGVIRSSTYDGEMFSGQDLEVLEVAYPELERTLEIYYESKFPHAIAGWSDTYKVTGGEALTSHYERISTIKSPYWSLHDLEDLPLRKEMGISALP